MSPDSTIRNWLAEQLAPLLPSGWKVAAGMGIPATIDRTWVAIKNLRIAPLAEAPTSHLNNFTTVTIASKFTDQAKATDVVDDQVLELVMDLLTIEGLTFIDANKVLVNDTYIGWDISLSIISRKKETPDG